MITHNLLLNILFGFLWWYSRYAQRTSFYNQIATWILSIRTLCFSLSYQIRSANDGRLNLVLGSSYIRLLLKVSSDTCSKFISLPKLCLISVFLCSCHSSLALLCGLLIAVLIQSCLSIFTSSNLCHFIFAFLISTVLVHLNLLLTLLAILGS